MFTPVVRFTLLLLVSVALFAACGEDDNPIVENGHDDEPFHADADGFVLKVDGNEIYRQFEGAHTGGITLKVGDELDVLTAFLDHDSHEFFPENPGRGRRPRPRPRPWRGRGVCFSAQRI